LQGEILVVQALQDLDDNYFLINDIKLHDSYGNIDHIVLGPNGIFVIETKNYAGRIICAGDEWIRQYEDRDYDLGSPSKQVKRNAIKIKQIIESSNIFKDRLKVWIEGIVVFTNPDVELQLANTTVAILQVDELSDNIKNNKSKIKFSSKEIELIGEEIIKRTEAE